MGLGEELQPTAGELGITWAADLIDGTGQRRVGSAVGRQHRGGVDTRGRRPSAGVGER